MKYVRLCIEIFRSRENNNNIQIAKIYFTYGHTKENCDDFIIICVWFSFYLLLWVFSLFGEFFFYSSELICFLFNFFALFFPSSFDYCRSKSEQFRIHEQSIANVGYGCHIFNLGFDHRTDLHER